MWIDGKWRWAPRLAFEYAIGPVPLGHDVCHKCDNPPCVNPDHLFAGTRAENNADMVAKGRARRVHGRFTGKRGPGSVPPYRRGEAHPGARLTEDAVRRIRAMHESGSAQRAIARQIGVSATAVRDVVSGRTWRHVA
jgi:hypothetical protein